MEELKEKLCRIINALRESDPQLCAELCIDAVARGLGKLGGRPLTDSERSLRVDVAPSVRFRIFERDRFRCRYCGRKQSDGAVLVVDHVIPVARGGRSTPGNLVTACDTCNAGKSDSLPSTDGSPETEGAASDLIPQQQQQSDVAVVAPSNSTVSVSDSGSSLVLFPDRISQQSSLVVRKRDEPLPRSFVEFWALYPRKVAKADALRAWNRLSPSAETVEVMKTAIIWQVEEWDAAATPPDKIPHPATWLNGRRWQDERPRRATGAGNGLSQKDRKYMAGSAEFIRRKQQQEENRDGK